MTAQLISRLSALALFGSALSGGAVLQAQTTVVVDSVTRTLGSNGQWVYNTWKPMLGVPGNTQTSAEGYLMDPPNEQQTGQSDSDFVSATVNGQANPGFFTQFGQINGVDVLAFRIILNEYKETGNVVNIRFGLEGNDGDGGRIDLYMGISQQNNSTGLVFQAPGNGANTSPSTSTLGNNFMPTASNYAGGVRPANLPAVNQQGNAIGITSTNFSNVFLADGTNRVGTGALNYVPARNIEQYYPGWVTQAEPNSNFVDAMITIAIPMIDINAALKQLGETWEVTPTRFMRWVAVTNTNNNSVNQDAYGTVARETPYADFSPLVDPSGNPIPEPATFGALLGFGLGGFFLLRRRHASAARAQAA